MCITGIKCTYREYRLENDKYIKRLESSFDVDSTLIDNMLGSCPYFSSLGGYMSFSQKPNRRFGVVTTKVFVRSICGAVQKVFFFNYDQAQVL